MGQLFMMGWEGQEVTPQIRSLIEDHHLGSIILTTKNLKCTCPARCFGLYFGQQSIICRQDVLEESH
jgi:hypothetical protein